MEFVPHTYPVKRQTLWVLINGFFSGFFRDSLENEGLLDYKNWVLLYMEVGKHFAVKLYGFFGGFLWETFNPSTKCFPFGKFQTRTLLGG